MFGLFQNYLSGYVGSIVRHGLTIAGGAAMTYGVVTPDQSAQFVELGAGVAMNLLGLGLSFAQKYAQNKLSR